MIKLPSVDSRWFLTSLLPDRNLQALPGLNLSSLELPTRSFSKAKLNVSHLKSAFQSVKYNRLVKLSMLEQNKTWVSNPGISCQSQVKQNIIPEQKRGSNSQNSCDTDTAPPPHSRLKHKECYSNLTGVFTGSLSFSQMRFHRKKLSTNALRKKLANLFYKYFRLFRTHGLSVTTTQFCHWRLKAAVNS